MEQHFSSEEGMPLFFKVEDRVKKVVFGGDSMDELRRLFFSKFSEAGWSMDNFGRMHIKHAETGIVFELESIQGLFCFLLFCLCSLFLMP